ncbi:MAG: hypothetical protein RI911_499 [Candidatus Parcubacteria bacterium]|jgi:hypothetical protein
MRPEQLILAIVTAYQDARAAYKPHGKIRRGRSHPISSITEDLFANYLVTNDASIDAVYIDQPISLASPKQQIYPDIVITRNGTITALVDIKMDLGWNRTGLYDLCKKHQGIVRKARSTMCTLKDGQTKKLRTLRLSKQLSYNIVLISRTNIQETLLDTQLKKVQSLSPELDVFVLCNKGTPNSYGGAPKQVMKDIVIDSSEFARLAKKLRA